MSKREGGLLAWQFASYPIAHRDRRNLAIHIATVPLFQLGTLAFVVGTLRWVPTAAIAGLATMAIVMALQGRGHKLEQAPPAPFLGPRDVFARIFAEQWINFPRFVLSGGFATAWREASPDATHPRG